MKLGDIDITNTIAIAQLTTVLVVIAFLLAFWVFTRHDKNIKSKRKE